MKLLIVDDEIFAIQGILDGVDWDMLTFDDVFTANSYSQALNIFQKEQIDILICDIEMPYGSGLDLVEWVKKHHPRTECIFLTCHDEFDFAKQAISLKCLDYILKPVPPEKLMKILIDSIDAINLKKKEEQYQKYGKHFLEELSEQNKGGEHKKPNDVIEEVEKYVQKHISESITVEEIAKRVFLSPDHLTRLFKKERGQTLIDYLTDQRMFWAKELLEKNELSISRISAKVGYGNYSYFTKVFKKYYGQTPRDYQANYRKKNRK